MGVRTDGNEWRGSPWNEPTPPSMCPSDLTMELKGTVLSLSFDSGKLQRREDALRSIGFDVISVHSPAQARFEIEMGRCGIFVTCRLVPDIVNRDLMGLFRRHCPRGGRIVLVTGHEPSLTPAYEPQPDVCVPESDDPEGIVEVLRAHSHAPSGSAT
jgi:hypothetical protein